MAKTQLTKQQKLEKKLKEIAQLKKSIKEDEKKLPLTFGSKVEKIWNKKLTEKEFNAIFDLIKQKKIDFDKCITPVATTTDKKPTTPPQQKPLGSNTTISNTSSVFKK